MGSNIGFTAFVDLLKKAENALVKQGISDADDRLTLLRGIYYGTPWSKDFSVEGSAIRNFGFTIYTGFTRPQDIRPLIGKSLFSDLQKSQDLVSSGLGIDIGHAFIGLDARNGVTGRRVPIPLHGGTGVEIVTWLGDLGGGAANLAWTRATTNPSAGVAFIFTSADDYGASSNLEGDIGGFLIGTNSGSLSAPSFSSGPTAIADAFKDYLLPQTAANKNWTKRTENFLGIYGASVSGTSISNKSALIQKYADQISSFAVFYMIQRYVMKNPSKNAAIAPTACKYLTGVASEVATVFVNALEKSLKHPANKIVGAGPWPKPSHKGQCNSTILGKLGSMKVKEITDLLHRNYLDAAKSVLDKVMSEL